ncbi:FliM/FliN family flagellar motor switch protein [Cedecea sp. FDAARGOS_727]|uniref:FliM/FliN family flagellar motor switch protein n=1 Tax=Cedecea sp. FDAARGOS_727 TaxID=2545798 RepID=UPI00143E174D|nr:FliM/FliN family flagellar motor switch protein [Cedecea sp. FDAARGOS_727]QIX96591.1 hypothetical protein FOC35_13260 [Cedecea sp. FDAARGOS_727]
MIRGNLRHYSSQELAWRQHILRWKSQGFVFQQGIKPGETLLNFTSDTGWEGVIDLQAWFAGILPESAKMSGSCWSAQQLEELFINSSNPLEGLPEELEYHQLASKGLTSRSNITDSMYSCQFQHARVWFYGIPENLAAPGYSTGGMAVGHLPVEIQFEVGHSIISISLLKRVSVGDVLLVNKTQNFIFSGGNIIGKFSHNEDGFMFDTEDDYTEIDFDDYENDAEAEPQKLMPRDKISVKLGFVLQQNRIAIDELESLYQGMVLPCDPDAEKNITITANGVAIARGEVVWIEDRLGVEVKELYQEPGDDSR